MALLCILWILVLVAAAIGAPVVAPSRYDTQDYANRLVASGHGHLLGTDELGQDELSRLLYGARMSLGVALVVVATEAALGVLVGLLAGYYGGWLDQAMMRVTDIVFAFPDILLAILLAAIVRSGGVAVPPVASIVTLFFALGVVRWPTMARIVRGQALALREKEFIEAARAIGLRDREILLRHMLPNLASPILVQVTQDIAAIILDESTLSFLGLGVPPPFPSWGRMIRDALLLMESHPRLLIIPSVALAITVMAFNFLGDSLRDVLDPRMR